MTRGHGWSLTITMRGIFTPYSLPAFTGAFDLTPLSSLRIPHLGGISQILIQLTIPKISIKLSSKVNLLN